MTDGEKIVNITAPLYTICARLGIDPSCVACLSVTPMEARATVYRLNEKGEKHIDPDTNKPAEDYMIFRVQT